MKKLIKNKKDNRFLQTASYFKKLIDEVQPDLNEFIKYLFKNTVLIRISCSDESFAIKLFSVLNDRGLDLTSADIIKAHLMQQLDDDKRQQFNEEWKKIEILCQRMDESLTNVFNLYLYYQTGRNPKNSLQDEFKIKFKDEKANSISLDLNKFANFLFEINECYDDKDISRLRYLPHSIYWKSILLTAKMKDYEEYDKLKSLLVKYYYQSWIADGTANRIKQTSFNLINMVKENKSIDEIKSILVKNLSEYNSYLNYLDRPNIYSSKWHKPLLLAIEYNQQDNYPYIEINKNLHTEHILPQEWNDKSLNWSDKFDSDTANLFLNSLGNLTLLSGNKNIRASNRNYAAKKEIYIGKGLDGKTSFEITKWVFENYPDEWNAETIQKRKEWLINEIKKIFEIK
ncbi:HNH endonuclease family protein [Avibacterium paragallinarum]|uniref:HNH endonuclease family protein n=1 Tax=Avibacterium paragallinarum TaxID=728 RepID=UPI0039863D4A